MMKKCKIEILLKTLRICTKEKSEQINNATDDDGKSSSCNETN